jgi:hypothetical protein
MTDIAELSVPISADTRAIDTALRKVEADLAKLGDKAPPIRLPPIDMPSGDPIGEPFRKSVPSMEAAERAALSFAQARARLLRDQGDLAGAERVLQGALNATTATTTRTIAAQRQLINVQKQIASAGNEAAGGMSRFSSMLGGITSAAGALGVGLGVGALVQFGSAAGAAAVSLERTQATMRAVAGSQERYNEVVRIAEANQKLFGGSLQSNLGPLQQFLFISNRSGAALDELNKAAQLLSTINPAEGFEGAGVALSEFFSGDITSLAERFNLPRAALRGLADEGVSAQDKIAGLEQLLAQQGITAATLNASLTENAATYNALGAAASQAFTDMGAAAAQAAAPVAELATQALRAVSANIQDTAAKGGTDAAALDPLIQASYESLTGAVRAYADAQIAAGASTGQALVAAQGYAATLDAISAAQATVSAQWDGSSESAAALAERMTTLANESAGNEATIRALATAYADGSLNIAQLEGSLTAMETAQLAAAAATAQAADASAVQADATVQAAAAAQEAAVAASAKALADLEQAAASEQASLVQDQLRDAILNAAAAGGDAEAAATAIARVFQGVEVPAVLALINAHRNLAAARRGAAGATEARDERNGAAARAEIGSMKAVAAQQERLAAARKAEADAARASAAATRGTGGGRRATGGGGGAASARASAATKAAQDVAKAEDQYRKASEAADRAYQDRAVDAEEAYQERRLSIMEDFAEKRRASEQSFADAQVSDKADFYTSLIGVDKAQRTAMIQEYEAAQAKAAEIAATQGADAGERYLSLITDIIQKRADRAAAIQKALEDGDKKEAEFLQGVDALARADEERKLARATEGSDLAGQEQSALADAADQRDEALANAAEQRQEAIASAAERAGDASVTAQQRLAQAAATSNIPLQEQLATLERIKQLGATGAAAAPATGTAQAPAAAPVPTTPVAPTTGGPVAVTDAAVPAGFAAVQEALRALARAVDKLGNSPAMGV